MSILKYFLGSVAIVLLVGCSSSEVFKPKQDVVGAWPYSGDLNSSISDVSSTGAVLENGHILHEDTILKTNINVQKQDLLNVEKQWIITSNIDGNVTLMQRNDFSKKVVFELGQTVAAASVHDDILAVLFASDNIALYSMSTKKILFQAQGNAPVAVDTRVVNPYFLNNLVIFPTLDGRLVIVNSTTKKMVKSIILSSKEYFNNVIHFNVAGNNLIASTGYKLVSLEEGEKQGAFDVRDLHYTKEGIYVATKQGEVDLLTPALTVKAKIKFPFAHFLGMIVTKERVYLLLRQGYIISLKKDLSTYKIYDADIDKDSYVYVGKKAFYVDDQYFSLKK